MRVGWATRRGHAGPVALPDRCVIGWLPGHDPGRSRSWRGSADDSRRPRHVLLDSTLPAIIAGRMCPTYLVGAGGERGRGRGACGFDCGSVGGFRGCTASATAIINHRTGRTGVWHRVGVGCGSRGGARIVWVCQCPAVPPPPPAPAVVASCVACAWGRPDCSEGVGTPSRGGRGPRLVGPAAVRRPQSRGHLLSPLSPPLPPLTTGGGWGVAGDADRLTAASWAGAAAATSARGGGGGGAPRRGTTPPLRARRRPATVDYGPASGVGGGGGCVALFCY